MPSQCKKINGGDTPTTTTTQGIGINIPNIPTPPTPTLNNGLSLEGQVLGNSNQIFLTLNTVKAFKFPN